MKKENRNNKGFSLVELIVVIAIMAVLVGVLAPQFIKYVEKSRQATDIQTIDNVVSAMKAYYADKETSDPSYAVTVPKGSGTVTGTGVAAIKDAGLEKAYLKGKDWSSGITVTYTMADGTIKITGVGGSKYYKVNADGDRIIPE